MRASSCLLPDVLRLASYTCGLHYPLPPERLHADCMNNRGAAIKSTRQMRDVPGRWCRPLHLHWKKKKWNSSQMVKYAAWLGGGLGGQAAERKLLNVSQLGRKMCWTSMYLDGKSRRSRGGGGGWTWTHTCETAATECSYAQRRQCKVTLSS